METLGAFSLTFTSLICYYYIMQKFSTVEDYIEVIAGMRDIATGKKSTNWFFGFQPIISLARYDTDVLDSMSQSATNGQALTERQGELACKIILKYQRQLAAKSVDVSPVTDPQWRLPLRKMDYSKRLYIENDVMYLKFPYDTTAITRIREFKKTSQGTVEFSSENKVWKIALTEYNLSWCYAWANSNQFEIDPAVEQLFNMITAAEQNQYSINLVCNDNGLDITNCPNSLRNYIQNTAGGFGMDNLIYLVDNSANLGYGIDEALMEAVIQEYGIRFATLATNRELRINPESRTVNDDFASVLDYAERVGRLPVVVYEPDLSERLLNKLVERYPADQLIFGNGLVTDVAPTVKAVHTIKPIRNMDPIPLLVSSAGMVFGGDKQTMIQHAEKIVYVAAEVYNTTNTRAKIKKLVTK